MAYHDNLLELAESILAMADGPGRPQQAHLRRAVSCAYYAVFHLLIHCSTSAMTLSGATEAERRRWRRVLGRTFDHKTMAEAARGVHACNVKKIGPVQTPTDLKTVCKALFDLRSARQDADYKLDSLLTKEDAANYVDQAKEAFEAWERTSNHPVAGLFLQLLHTYDRFR